MLETIGENWPLVFVLAWLAGAYGLSLLLSPAARRRAPRNHGTQVTKKRAGGRAAGAGYACIDYRMPPRSNRTLAKAFGNSPDVRALYVRSEFLLTLAAGFTPDEVLVKWAASPAWSDDRERFAQNRKAAQSAALAAARRGDFRSLYTPPRISPSKPLALNFCLLPSELALFVGTRFSIVDNEVPRMMEQGMYLCRIVGWREEDGFAHTIDCTDMHGQVFRLDQTSILEAVRLRRAALEGLYFCGLPLYRFVSRSHPLPPLEPEQKVAHKMPLRMASPRDFLALDSRLLKLMGGVNPINLVRLSRFYHPSTGLKPDEPKYQKLVGKAREAGLSGRK